MRQIYTKEFFIECGRKGGLKGGAKNKKKGKKYFKELQKRSVEARFRNKKLSTDDIDK